MYKRMLFDFTASAYKVKTLCEGVQLAIGKWLVRNLPACKETGEKETFLTT